MLETGGETQATLSEMDMALSTDMGMLGASQVRFGLQQVPAISIELQRLEREVECIVTCTNCCGSSTSRHDWTPAAN